MLPIQPVQSTKIQHEFVGVSDNRIHNVANIETIEVARGAAKDGTPKVSVALTMTSGSKFYYHEDEAKLLLKNLGLE